jgi:broad specificity phosphatase PhoE
VTTLYLVRHGSNDWIQRGIAGRTPHVHLNTHGKDQAAALATWFESRAVQAIYSSPLERAQETAEVIGCRLNLPIVIDEDLNELDFGDWNGKPFTELDPLPDWQKFNALRSQTRPPNGESFLEVQNRMVKFTMGAFERHQGLQVVIVGHGDPIRSVLMHFLGIPIDFHARLDVRVGSISVLEFDGWSASIPLIGHTLAGPS